MRKFWHWFKHKIPGGKILREVGVVEGVAPGAGNVSIRVETVQLRKVGDAPLVRLNFVFKALMTYRTSPITLSKYEAETLMQLIRSGLESPEGT